MRLERDALGELEISDAEYFGIATERLSTTIPVPGPEVPIEISRNIVRVRKAQAVAFGRKGLWNPEVSTALQKAADRILSGSFSLKPHLRVRVLHGGGARSLVNNIDEVLANVALEELGRQKGEYHLIAPLFQMDLGLGAVATFMTALHIALLEELDATIEGIDRLVSRLRQKRAQLEATETLIRIQFQDMAISDLGSDFSLCAESLMRSREQFEWFRSRLRPCWQGPSEVLLALRESSGMDLSVCQKNNGFPQSVDLYVGLSALLKATAMTLLQFCNSTRVALVLSKELESPLIRANTAFHPKGRETLVPDSVSQAVLLIIGGDATLAAAINAGNGGALAYLPVFSSQLVWCGQWLTLSLNLLSEKYVTELTGDKEAGRLLVENSPLQAEKLIAVFGYDRAVQVARIAALTEKPVRTVVKKMKLLDEAQIQALFPLPREEQDDEGENTGE